jgi:hypothetical protein
MTGKKVTEHNTETWNPFDVIIPPVCDLAPERNAVGMANLITTSDTHGKLESGINCKPISRLKEIEALGDDGVGSGAIDPALTDAELEVSITFWIHV